MVEEDGSRSRSSSRWKTPLMVPVRGGVISWGAGGTVRGRTDPEARR